MNIQILPENVMFDLYYFQLCINRTLRNLYCSHIFSIIDKTFAYIPNDLSENHLLVSLILGQINSKQNTMIAIKMQRTK